VSQFWVVILGVVGGLVTGFAGAVWGPLVTGWFERRRKASELRGRYSPPLLQAAFDLQSRLYNIGRLRFLQTYLSGEDEGQRADAENSTLWLLAQYLGWVEILRREAQFLDFGKRTKNRELQGALEKIASQLASDKYGPLAVFRPTQRAIGELMIVPPADPAKPTASLDAGSARPSGERSRVWTPPNSAWPTRTRNGRTG